MTSSTADDIAVEQCSVEIVPLSVLKDDDSVYQCLCRRLNAAHTIDDLIPFVAKLTSVQSLKQYLQQQLDQQYEREQQLQLQAEAAAAEHNYPRSVLRSLFISLFLFNGIPSDYMQANIFSFLPNADFRTLAMLSRNFRYILKHFAFLYNHKNYCVQLQFLSFARRELRTYRRHPQNFTDTITLSRVNHSSRHPNVSICVRLSKEANLRMQNPSTKKRLERDGATPDEPAWINGQQLRSMDDLDALSVPVSSVNDWIITHNNFGRHSKIAPACNAEMIAFLRKAHTKLESVTIEDWNLDDICYLFRGHAQEQEQDEKQTDEQEQEYRFAQCICFRLVSPKYHSPTRAKLSAKVQLNYHAMFGRLQCIELVNHHCDTRECDKFYVYVAQVMKSLRESTSLQCVRIVHSNKYRRPHRSTTGDTLCTLHIPRNVQWLSVHLAEYDVDLSECRNLIGVQFYWILASGRRRAKMGPPRTPVVQWPSNDCCVKFLCAQPELLEQVKSERCNVKFMYVCDGVGRVAKRKHKSEPVVVSIQQYMTAQQNDKRVVLSSCDRTDESVFNELLSYHFKTEGPKQHALQMYRKWWSVRHALWIKHIHAYTMGLATKARRSVPVFTSKNYDSSESSSSEYDSDSDYSS